MAKSRSHRSPAGNQKAALAARKRVGTTAEAQLRWLLHFAHTDLSGFSQARRRAAEIELIQFLSRQTGLRGPVGEGLAVLPELSTGDLERLHAWLADGIRAVQSGGRWNFKSDREVSIGLYEGKLSGNLIPERNATWFRNRVLDTLFLAGDKLQRCADFPSCANLYVPRHGRQAYCSNRCSQRVRTRTWRQAHPVRAKALRHAQYRKQVQRLKGSAVAAKVRQRKQSKKP